MAEKQTEKTAVPEKISSYVVADGYAFTNKGIVYKPGNVISSEVFAKKSDFDAAVKAGMIVKGISK